jgi:glycosyltransferase involved in cell wall biosynthesis
LKKTEPQQFEKLKSLYRRCSLSVLPSLYEPFGLSHLEAMASGIPSVVSGAWALQETVKAGVVGETVKPGDADELAAKIINLLQHPETLREYGERCRPYVGENFRWEKVVDRLEAFLKERRKN